MDVVGAKEIAERLRVPANTVHQWSKRGLLPPAAGTVSGLPAWAWQTIENWARSTGRLPGLREQVLAALARTPASTSPIAGQLIAAGYAKSITQVGRVLNDLVDDGLVGRVLPDHWVLTDAGRQVLTPTTYHAGRP